MKEIFLHIGSPKTGSTTIQKTFFKNRDFLLKNGILYPSTSEIHFFLFAAFKDGDIKSLKHVGCFTPEESKKYIQNKMSIFEREISQECVKTIFLSSEQLSDLSENGIHRLYKYLHKFVDKITVICYVRDPRSYLVSQTQQFIKQGVVRYGEPVSSEKLFLSKDVLTKYINVFGVDNIIIRKFDKNELVNNDVLCDFISSVNLDDYIRECLTCNVENSNESISTEGLIIMDKIHQMLKEQNKTYLKNISAIVFSQGMRGEKFSLSSKDYIHFKKVIDDDLNFLNEIFGVTFNNKLFIDKKNELFTDIAIEDISKNLLHLLESNQKLISQNLVLLGDIDILNEKKNAAKEKYYKAIEKRPDNKHPYLRLIKMLSDESLMDEVNLLKIKMKQLCCD